VAQSGRNLVFDPAGQSLNGASFAAVEQLQEHIDAFIAAYNETAEPFAWTKKKVYQRGSKIAVSLNFDSGSSSLPKGRPLANREGRSREIGVAEGVPALGLDGLSSSAYGPEAALSILVAAGAAGLAELGPIMLVILALLAILFVSYWQTIKAYPISGGAYTVAKKTSA